MPSTNNDTFDCVINASLEDCIRALITIRTMSVIQRARRDDSIDLEVRVYQWQGFVPVDLRLQEDAHFYGTAAQGQVTSHAGKLLAVLGVLSIIGILLHLNTLNADAIHWTRVIVFLAIYVAVLACVNWLEGYIRRKSLGLVLDVLKSAEQ